MLNDSWRRKVTSVAILALLAHTQASLSTRLIEVITGSVEMRISPPLAAEPTIVSPLHSKPFIVAAVGEARFNPAKSFEPRVVVAVEDETLLDSAKWAVRASLRCWEASAVKLGFDVPPTVDHRRIVLFLCKGGDAGGEQILTNTTTTATGRPMSAIYLYQVPTLNDPIERLREVAHEWGHALFPPIGGFTEPESWSNGDMGERLLIRLFDRWARDLRLGRDDLAEASIGQMDAYLKDRYDPLVDKIALNGPQFKLERQTDLEGFNYTVGMMCFAHAVFPSKVFRRGIELGGGRHTGDLSRGFEEAASEAKSFELTFPERLVGRQVWIPTLVRAVGGGKVVSYRGAWTRVILNSVTLTVTR